MKIADRHRINPKKVKHPKPDLGPSTVRLRRKSDSQDPRVLYMNKSAYGSLATDEAVDGMLSRINEEFSVSVKDDVDSFLSNIFRRGWKVSHIDLSVGRIYSAKFFR